MLAEYSGVLVILVIAIVLAGALLGIHLLVGPRREFPEKQEPFECGEEQITNPQQRFAVKFYVTAMLFILFDIEIVFLIPWVLVFREFLAVNLPILLPIFFFLFVLVLGLFYELKKGAIEWEQ